MTTGRLSISPHPDHKIPVVSGLGADEAKVVGTMDGDEFFCGVCNGDGAVFGVEDDVDKELKASDEGEQAVRIVPLPTPFQPSLSQCMDDCVTHYPYQSWCPYCVEVAESLVTTELSGIRVRPRQCRSIMRSSETMGTSRRRKRMRRRGSPQ